MKAYALSNTRVYSYIFLNSKFAVDLYYILRLKPKQLPYPIYLKRFNSSTIGAKEIRKLGESYFSTRGGSALKGASKYLGVGSIPR